MKALIFNSGLGSRLGKLTAENPKCLVKLGSGETILHRQLRLLVENGVRDFVITTGPFAQKVEAVARGFEAAGCRFEFFNNPVYDKTNYIYSMWLAREALRGEEILMLHGDLVFDSAYVREVLDAPLPSLGSVDPSLPLPPKDFKARIADGCVREVSVGIFDDDCVAFQPFYRLSSEAMDIWLDAVERFVGEDTVGVYAENAANEVFAQMGVKAFSYEGHFVEEVDTPEDLARVSAAIRLHDFAQQPVYEVQAGGALSLVQGFSGGRPQADLATLLARLGVKRPLVVAEGFFEALPVKERLEACGIAYTRFGGFTSNPTLQEVLAGIDAFEAGKCDSLISVGGGSAIDIAKCVKQFSGLDETGIRSAIAAGALPWRDTPHVAMPTTAGTGSESTHFAVMYVDGKKISVAADGLQPDAALLDASLLAGLSMYQKKCTMLDALCQAIESYWSVRSGERSRAYSREAIPAIMENYAQYLGTAGATPEGGFDAVAAACIMRAANRAGHAINLTTTTAAHAMSYKLTSLYGIPHGHAVAMCLPGTWQALIDASSVDEGLSGRLREISELICGEPGVDAAAGLAAFEALVAQLELPAYRVLEGDLDTLAASVNVQRLSNFPLQLSEDDLRSMYAAMMVE